MLLLFEQLWQGKTALTVLLLVSSYSSLALAAYMSLNCSGNFSSCAGLVFFFFFFLDHPTLTSLHVISAGLSPSIEACPLARQVLCRKA